MNPPPRGPPAMLPFGVAPPMIPLGVMPMPPPMSHPMMMQPPMTRLQAPPDIGPLNVFVGKLPHDLHDNYVRNLLERVGTVVQWKRTTDPISGKPKAFGYCTYATALDCIRALKLLNGFSLDSKNILLKVDTTTQTKLDEYSAQMPPQLQFEEDQKNERVAAMLQRLFEERSGLHGGYNNDIASWGDLMENVDSGAKEEVRGGMIMSEVEKFRLAQEERSAQLEAKRLALIQEKLRRDKEDAEKGATNAVSTEQEPKRDTRDEPSRRASPPRRGDRYRRSRSRSRDRRYRDSRRRSRSRSRSRDRGNRSRRLSSPGEASPRDTRPLAPPASSSSSTQPGDSAISRETHSNVESHHEPAKPAQPPRRPVAKIELKLQKKDKADAKPTSASAPAPAASAVFGVDDEETSKPQRDFVPLDYTDEEKLAASVEAQVARTVARINSRSDGVEGLIKSIPTDKNGLFRYPVDWAAVEKYKVVDDKMTPWVKKKIVEYLGEEEVTLIGFVLRQLHQRTEAQAIVDELVPVLEQDAETFVLTMWRKLIFEVLRADGGN